MAKTKKTTTTTTPSSKVRKKEKSIEHDPRGRGTIGPTSAKIMYIKMRNGEEMVSLISTLKDHEKELREDIVMREKDAKKRAQILAVVEDNARKERAFRTEKDSDKIFVIYYPALVTYMSAGAQKTPAMFLSPWVSTAVTSNQIFNISADQISTMFEPSEGVKTYFSEIMRKMIFSITLSMHQETLQSIDPKSELGKIVRGLSGNNQPQQKKAEDEEDDYIAAVLEKSRKPLVEDASEANKHLGNSPSAADVANTVPSIIVAGDKKTLH
jgi:hypothetical protein